MTATALIVPTTSGRIARDDRSIQSHGSGRNGIRHMKTTIGVTEIFNAGCMDKINVLLRQAGIDPDKPYDCHVEGGVMHVTQDEAKVIQFVRKPTYTGFDVIG